MFIDMFASPYYINLPQPLSSCEGRVTRGPQLQLLELLSLVLVIRRQADLCSLLSLAMLVLFFNLHHTVLA